MEGKNEGALYLETVAKSIKSSKFQIVEPHRTAAQAAANQESRRKGKQQTKRRLGWLVGSPLSLERIVTLSPPRDILY